MAEAIVGPLLTKLKDVAVTEAQALAAVGGEIETLSDKLMWLQALVHEADLRSRHDGSRLVRVLACQIRGVAFDAEDAVDEFYLKGDLSRRFALAQRFGRNWARASAELVLHFRTHFSVRFALSGRIQAMNARLEAIINNNSKFSMDAGSTSHGVTWRASRAIPQLRDDWENSTRFKLETRQEEAKELVKKLVEGSDGPIKILRVVGVGGIGRRSLLMYAYKEESVKKHFHVRVCVSFPAGICDMKIIVHKIEEKIRIVKQIKEEHSKGSSMSPLVVDSRCLIVIHSPISIRTWSKVEDELLKLKLGKGSKILLPWRKMQSGNDDSIIELRLLANNPTKTFFNYVYSGSRNMKKGTNHQTEALNKIRDNIMEITNGLPLAVVLLAKLIGTMDLGRLGAASECLMSSNGDGLSELNKILSVCIDDLPDELKSCLFYTAGFPENRIIDAHQLVRLWMAEGFLTRQMGLEAEQLGQCYLKELICRGLLQLIRKTSGADGDHVESVAIHDQIHPLLRIEAQHTSFMDFHYGGHMPPQANTRRLALYKYSKTFSAPNSCLDKLRTALSFWGEDENSKDHYKDSSCGAEGTREAVEEKGAKSRRKEVSTVTVMRKLLRGSPFLRVMDLEGPSHETELPHEIEEMVHLQYLRVRCGSLQKVPSSLGNLGKLQTLDVRGTKVKKLPKSLWKTKTLRHVLGDGLVLPRSTGDLKLLQTLETVTIHNNQEECHWRCKPRSCGRRSREQSGLRLLHRLGIVEMENCKPLENVIKDDLGDQLESLSLSGNHIPMDPTKLASAGAQLSHVASLELRGKLLLPDNPPVEKFFLSCLSSLTRLVLGQTMINQDFIHAIAKLPMLADLEMEEGSYEQKEVIFCGNHGFPCLTVLRIDSLGTLIRVIILHSADSRREQQIEPEFLDMDMVKTGSNNDFLGPNNHIRFCSTCSNVDPSKKVQADVWQHPGNKMPHHHYETITSQMQVKTKILDIHQLFYGGQIKSAPQVDIWKKYQYGTSLYDPMEYSELGTQMYLLNKWYLEACARKVQFLQVRVRNDHYFRGNYIIHVEFSELHQLCHHDSLDKSLLSCYCLYEMRALRNRRDTTIGFIDPYIVFKDPLTPNWQPIAEENLMNFLVNQHNKTMILFQYICENHWILMVIDLALSQLKILDSFTKDIKPYRSMINIIQRVWRQFIQHHRRDCKAPLDIVPLKEPGNNLCGYYVCEFIMAYSNRIPEEILKSKWSRQKVLLIDQIQAIQEKIAGFLNDQVINPNVEHYYDQEDARVHWKSG